MTKVVIDTNVLISAFLFGGNPREVLNLAITGKVKNYTCKEILDEISNVLIRPKFRFDSKKIIAIIHEIEAISDLIILKNDINNVTFDRADDYILACAVIAGVEYLVTGDNDLLEIIEYQGTKIITPAAFIEQYQE